MMENQQKTLRLLLLKDLNSFQELFQHYLLLFLCHQQLLHELHQILNFLLKQSLKCLVCQRVDSTEEYY